MQHSALDFATQSEKDLFEFFHSSSKGLSPREAHQRQITTGGNIIRANETTWKTILLRQFRSPFLYLLLAASFVSLLLHEALDGGIILLFVAINTILGFFQEYRSEKTLKLLNKYLIATTKVIRDGKPHIVPSVELVPGDIIRLEPGDIIPADVRFLETENLMADESVLTGESSAVEKNFSPREAETTDVYKAMNIGFSGTTIVSGEGTAIIVAIGSATQYGTIASLTTRTIRESTYEKQLQKFSKFTLGLVLVTLALLILANIVIKEAPSFVDLAIFSIALAVSVIPEGLPVVMTFSLSVGALHMAKKSVVVKRLSAIEDLGSIEVLCSDKTGTLTQNVMSVVDIWGDRTQTLIHAGYLALHTAKSHYKGNASFNKAIEEALSPPERNNILKAKLIHEIPFDPGRKRTTKLFTLNNERILLTMGAPEHIEKLLSSSEKKKIQQTHAWIAQQGKEGKRLLVVAKKSLENVKNTDNLLTLEHDLLLVGIIAFADPVKPTTIHAIHEAKQLGIQVKILTGDSREVAGYVATQIHLIQNPGDVLLGDELDALPIDKQHDAVEQCHVFARVTPQQKHTIIKLLQEKHEVGFLGEGINDGPALKMANVALVVDGASDIAKEAADIVLLEKSLNVIIEGIREGRKVFANTKKYITATLSANFGNFFAVSLASLLIEYLPMLPLQILLVNLLSDFPMIAVATDSVDEASITAPSRYDFKAFALIALLLGTVSTVFDFIFFSVFVRINAGTLHSAWFMGSILTELLFLFSIRTPKFFLRATRPSGMLVMLTAIAGVVTIILPQTSIGVSIFRFTPLSSVQLTGVIVIVLCYLMATEAVKILYYRGFKKG